MQNQRTQTIPQNRDFVFDNKVAGNVDALTTQHEQLKNNLKHYNKHLTISSSELQEALVKVIAQHIPANRGVRLTAQNVEVFKARIEAGLTEELGAVKAKNLTQQLIKDVSEKGVVRASENLVKNFELAGQKSLDVKTIRAFTGTKKTSEASKYDKNALIQQMMLNKPRSNSANNKQFNAREDLSFRKAAAHHAELISARNSTIKQMRRTARTLRQHVSHLLEINYADNGIAFNKMGLEIARTTQCNLGLVLDILNTSEGLATNTAVQKGNLNIDTLLQRGQASMMQARNRSLGLQRHLVRQREREMERVRC